MVGHNKNIGVRPALESGDSRCEMGDVRQEMCLKIQERENGDIRW